MTIQGLNALDECRQLHIFQRNIKINIVLKVINYQTIVLLDRQAKVNLKIIDIIINNVTQTKGQQGVIWIR